MSKPKANATREVAIVATVECLVKVQTRAGLTDGELVEEVQAVVERQTSEVFSAGGALSTGADIVAHFVTGALKADSTGPEPAEEPAGVPRKVYWKLASANYGPSWAEFEIDDTYVRNLNEAAALLGAGGLPGSHASTPLGRLGVQSLTIALPPSRWRGTQDAAFDEEQQAEVDCEGLIVSVAYSLDPPMPRISLTAFPTNAEEFMRSQDVRLDEFLQWHRATPPGEALYINSSGELEIDDPEDAEDGLRAEVAEADAAEVRSRRGLGQAPR